MPTEDHNVESGTISESDSELLDRLRESLQEMASDLTISHEEVWARIGRRRTALRTLEEQMKKSA